MKKFNELTGYNKNKFVKEEHVFIPGIGTCHETKEKAIAAGKAMNKTGNMIGLHIIEHEIEDLIVYEFCFENVWN